MGAACAGEGVPGSAAASGPTVGVSTASPRFRQSGQLVAGSYVVVLAADPAADDVAATADALLTRYGGTRTAVYARALRGFAAQMPEAVARRLSDDPRVAYVEQNNRLRATQIYGSGDAFLGADATGVTVGAGNNEPANWALDRIDQAAAPPVVGGVPQFDGSYGWRATGARVNVYLLDSGIQSRHVDLYDPDAPRVFGGPNFVTPGAWSDLHPHGTAMASIIGGRVAGVAKRATIKGVQVLDANNETDLARLLQGLDWIAANAVRPAVVNLSISGPADGTFNAAVASLVNQYGLTVVGAAGNAGVDACTTSPASEPTAITVGAVNGFDQRSVFSNYGPCVDISAPGTATNAATYTVAANNLLARERATGTSTSTALVTGVVALYLQRNPLATPAEVRAALLNNATTGALDAATLQGTPDRLLYAGFVPYAAQTSSGLERGTNYVSNSGFESGAADWFLNSTSQVVTTGAWGGARALLLGDLRGASASAYSNLTGSLATSSVVSDLGVRFRLQVSSTSPAPEGDRLQVKLGDFATGPILASYDGRHASSAYTEEWIEVPQFAATPKLQFLVTTTNPLPLATNFVIDSVRLMRAAAAEAAWTPLQNANFELGDNGTWTKSGGLASSAFTNVGCVHKTGGCVRFTSTSATATTVAISQNLAVPAGAVAPRIRIPVVVSSSRPSYTATPADVLTVEVRNPATDSLLATLGHYNNQLSGSNQPYATAATYSLQPWVGQTVRLRIRAALGGVSSGQSTAYEVDNIEAFVGTPALQ